MLLEDDTNLATDTSEIYFYIKISTEVTRPDREQRYRRPYQLARDNLEQLSILVSIAFI